jgi:broad specificity phosphatase PhoE
VPAGGSSARPAGKRLASFIGEVADRYRGKVVVAVTHAGVIADFLLNGRTPGELTAENPRYTDMEFGAVTELSCGADDVVLVRLADTAYLARP